MKTSVIAIEGMTCGGCVASVTKALQQVAGVQNVKVALSPAQAEVTFDENMVDDAALHAAVQNAGFDVG